MINKSELPAWAREYLTFQAWTAHELRSLVCGVPPKQPLDEAPRTREETNEAYVRAELNRVAAHRHIRDAIATGQLRIVEPPDEALIKKIRRSVTPEELQQLIRAIAHDRTCEQSYRVERDEAIQWARSRRDVFPDFPFLIEAGQPSAAAHRADDVAGPERLKAHRNELVRQALIRLDLKKGEFCRQKSISPDTLRGMINGEVRRFGQDKNLLVLKLLGISAAEWDGP